MAVRFDSGGTRRVPDTGALWRWTRTGALDVDVEGRLRTQHARPRS
ncbi:hypothetical protein GCM10023403_18500 [Pseudonocardia benzenivorans]|jgi:hypothetical protein|nr:hypothetical protein PSD17_09640 [Pseudonocardia sp. D17]